MHNEELNNKLKQLNTEDFIWLLYIGIIIDNGGGSIRQGLQRKSKDWWDPKIKGLTIKNCNGSINPVENIVSRAEEILPRYGNP